MSDDVDARGSADGKGAHSNESSPDHVGEELADGARIWRLYDRVAREEDRERIGTWNRGLDNLALFAGLFSAVTTAFIIEARKDTEPDYARLSFLVLNASAAGVPFQDGPFVIDSSVRATYCLWIASLMLSLTAALIAIMGKDWVGTYASRPVCNPRQWAEIRTYRLACVDRWYMSGVIASAPVLLHISLLLFAAGLVLFVAPDELSQRVALGFALAAGGVYLVAVLSAIFVPTSPFRSPATQAVRGAVSSLWVSLYDWISYPPKRRPIALLQQATLIISAALGHPSPAIFLPLDRVQHRRLRLGAFRAFWNRLLTQIPFHLVRSWRNAPQLFVGALRAYLLMFPAFVFDRVRSAVEAYHHHWKNLHPRPWRATVRLYLQKLELYNRWAAVRNQPTPGLIAHSLSDLNTMTQSPAIFQAILVALGDIAIGRKVAPLVSSDLKSRLRTQIRHISPTTDLVTLSRIVLVDLHLSDTPRILPGVVARLTNPDRAVRSESIVFALVELLATPTSSIDAEMIDRYFPDALTQPRALEHLLPLVTHIDVLIVLCQRYWDPSADGQSVNVEDCLRRLFSSQLPQVEVHLANRFGGAASLIDILVCLLDFTVPGSISTGVCVLIIKALNEMSLSGVQGEHPSVVYAFGHPSPVIADAAWAALSAAHSLPLLHAYALLEQALPLSEFMPRRRGLRLNVDPHLPDSDGTFDICLARTVVRLLSPSRHFSDSLRSRMEGSSIFWVSTLELCARCLHAFLCQPRGPPDDAQQLEIITHMLDHSALTRLRTLWGSSYTPPPSHTPEGRFMDILTSIARRVGTLLGSGDARGARLARLLAFSEATGPGGQPMSWDLAAYLREAEQAAGTGADVSMRHLQRALRTLRPLCAARDDLRAAWARVGLAPDVHEYHDPWDCDDFALGVPEVQEQATPQAPPREFNALEWLDAAMH